jgi:predicted nucleotidyltransferase
MMDDVLARLVADAQADPDTLAVVLAGSRARGHEHAGSDYDVYLVRTVPEKPLVPEDVEAACTTLEELRSLEPYWWTDGLVAGRVLHDETDGALERELERLGAVPEGAAHDAYDGYLNAFVRGMGAARRGDELAQRLHAADSVRFLVRALHALDGRRAPFHDHLDGLPDDWRYPLLEILRTADPAAQRALQGKVEALMTERGVLAHEEWGANFAYAKSG